MVTHADVVQGFAGYYLRNISNNRANHGDLISVDGHQFKTTPGGAVVIDSDTKEFTILKV